MTNDEARAMLKEAIDPLFLGGLAIASLSGSLIGKRIGEALRRRSLKKGLLARLLKDSSDRKAKIQSHRKQLHKLVRPMARKIPYKTKGAKGWDVMVDAMLTDSQSTGASK